VLELTTMAPIRREETPSTPPDGSDMTMLRETHIAIGAVSRRVGEIDEKLERALASINELAETVGQLSASLVRLEAAAGTTPPARVGSSPQLDRLIDTWIDGEETEVRARRLALEQEAARIRAEEAARAARIRAEEAARAAREREEEAARAAANQRKAALWALGFKWAAFIGPWVGALVGGAIMRACGGG
jgi:hypothetical protein